VNTPNKLTAARFACVPAFLAFIYYDNVATLTLALLIFIGAGITDLVDGYLARKHNLVTSLGVFMDPLADKLITTAAFISFVEVEQLHVPAWMVVLIVGREFLITGLRSLAASQGQIVAADEGGKFKTSAQTTAIITILVVMIVRAGLDQYWIAAGLPPLHTGWRATVHRVAEWIPYWMTFIATLFSLVTGISYLRKHMPMLQKSA
jgi:CDP-diacylglycerol--glycerol-3-phosphate 3-phosphatidyltransferase